MPYLRTMKTKSNALSLNRDVVNPRNMRPASQNTRRTLLSSVRNRAACFSLALLLLPAPALLLSTPPAFAQAAKERIVEGVVTNKDDQPISGAVVYLKDSKSLAMKTYLTDEHGHYRFGELSQNTDYELWAEHDGEKSKSRNISSFDSRANFIFSFRVDKKK